MLAELGFTGAQVGGNLGLAIAETTLLGQGVAVSAVGLGDGLIQRLQRCGHRRGLASQSVELVGQLGAACLGAGCLQLAGQRP